MKNVKTDIIGKSFSSENGVDNQELIRINAIIRNHPVEIVDTKLRTAMTAMKVVKTA